MKRIRIEGYAIVSRDGMIADAAGVHPPALMVEADQKFFHTGLDRADAVVNGRNSNEGGPKSLARRRLVVTRSIPKIAPDPINPNAVLWNPAGATLNQAWDALKLEDGVLVVIGGTYVFGMFLDVGYDAFHLTRADNAQFPGGRPVFPGVGQFTPEELLRARGLVAGPKQILDPAQNVSLTTWRQP
jgi:dihydrofolate reductase